MIMWQSTKFHFVVIDESFIYVVRREKECECPIMLIHNEDTYRVRKLGRSY